MSKEKNLTKKQLAFLVDFFNGGLEEKQVLEKNNISFSLYNKWLTDENFTVWLDRYTASAYRRSAALIARYAPKAASTLIHLTSLEKSETARKACMDIISVPNSLTVKSRNSEKIPEKDSTQTLSASTAQKILEILASENGK